MIQGTSNGKLWFYYLVSSYLFVYTIGLFLIENLLGAKGFAAIPYTRAIYTALLVGSIFMFVPMYLLNRKINLQKNDVIIITVIVYLSLFSASIGFLKNNSLAYLLADTAYLLLGLLIYLFTKLGNVFIYYDNRSINKIALFLGGSLLISRFVLELNALLPSLFFLLGAILVYCIFSNYWRGMWICLIPILIMTPFLNRTAPLAVILLIILTLSIMVLRGKIIKTFKIILPTTFILIISGLLISNISLLFQFDLDHTPLGRRVISTLQVFGNDAIDVTKDLSFQQRLYEVQKVNEKLGTNPLNWLLGVGYGGTIDMSASLDSSVKDSALLGETEVHNVHILPAAVVFRYGLLGLFVLLLLILKFVVIIFKEEEPSMLIPAMSSIIVIFYSFSASSVMVTEPLLWFSMACLTNRKSLFQEKKQFQPCKLLTHRS